MKKTLFLLLLAPLALVSCKKDKTEDAEATIIGKWSEKSFAYEYFNSSGTKIFSETSGGGATWDFSANSVIYQSQSSTAKTSGYTIKTVNGKKMLSFDNINVSEGYEMEIKSISSNSMVWHTEATNVEYYDNGDKTAAKATLVVTFSK